MNIKVSDGFVVNPTIEVKPVIRISPFMECDLGMMADDTECAIDYLNKRFGHYCITIKAREAIKTALSFYGLASNDIVSIFTTSNNFYVSGCVTSAIETVCRWSREVTKKTKVILVIHEFGYPCHDMEKILGYGVPVIEDCALSFASQDSDNHVGRYGDFAIYSFPKFFPMQVGGLLVSNKYDLSVLSPQVTAEQKNLIFRMLSLHIPYITEMLHQRLDNYYYLESRLKQMGIISFFPLKKGTYPAVYLFKWHKDINYPLLKEFMQSNGIESSVFYGKNAFFVPLHHRQTKRQIDYIVTLLKQFVS